MDRRRFFRRGLSELMRPLAAAMSPLEQAARKIEQLEAIANSKRSGEKKIPLTVWLRPPGALPEQQFKETCSRCGECVRVCPAEAIKLDASGKKGDGAPYIDADAMACVVCEGLQCMQVCPSGALVPTPLVEIDMGTAVWRQETCLRSKGENCTICVDQCPLGTAAIEIKGGDVAVNPLGCIGCGVCQHYCPTSPKSVYVIPIAAKTARG